ncbi:MerR family transcriptional regulator [Oceanirhabdus seepicola]|uniref:MerR family transcriptional regulator n=1 Tax=Oceanirhabdus seepicola TaxID=2828781 RepID=A0A9J6NXI9_9CLOT|nr:MerR family transcriptional regulator [Oceanirhabdus seepicola]MCM1988341.1 MerR family transcriptional regulator [Oceanirhabdus seepicola]
MYKIGEFSKIVKVSKRMLRYYDEKALLKTRKDDTNGYRYYTDNDIELINKIKLLRKYEFSVEEIKSILKMDLDSLKISYKNKINELSKNIDEYFDIIDEMKCYIKCNSTIDIVNTYDVFSGRKKGFYGVSLRRVVDEKQLEALFEELINSVNKLNPKLNGKYFAIFHSINEDDNNLYEVEVCQPILTDSKLKDTNIKFFKEYDYISTIHFGNYNDISYAYAALINWAKLNNYSLEGPYIERYYTDESVTIDKNAFVTEVSISVKKS